jgi:ferredoxin--NADP+ reductase
LGAEGLVNKILKKRPLIPGKVTEMTLDAPEIAGKAKPGNFVILRINEAGERFPLTIADADPEAGTITIVYLVLGRSTAMLEALDQGDEILDLCGPLGQATDIRKVGTVVCVGGGTGIAAMHHIAKGHARAGNRVISIIGARSADLLLFEEELRKFSHEVLIATDDGSRGTKGFVTHVLQKRLEEDADVKEVVAVGPVPMMRAVAETTRPLGLKTVVSLNSIMVDGMGMCGACRVRVDDTIRFACVDGPEFDAHQVDFDELTLRLGSYVPQEKESYKRYCECHEQKS